MTVTALVAVGGANQTTGLLAAVVGADDVRGVQDAPLTPQFGPFAGRALYHLTIHGDVDGEGLAFTFCAAVGGSTTKLDQKVAFAANGRRGSAVAPFVLTAPLSAPLPAPRPRLTNLFGSQ